MTDEYMKTCTKCEEALPLSSFYKRLNSEDGLRARCKSCTSAENVERRRLKRTKQMWLHSLRNGEDRARGLGLPAEKFTQQEMVDYWETKHIDPDASIYSGEPLGESFNLDHFVPLSDPNSPGHVLSNVVPALEGENRTKSANNWVVGLADIHKKRGTVTPPELDGKLIRSEWTSDDGSNK